MRNISTIFAAAPVLLGLTQPAVAATPNVEVAKVDQRKTAMQSEVEVDIYSGRPNPRFGLGPGQTAELERRIAALPPLSVKTSPRNGLGYRGVLVRDSGTFADLIISAGTVTIRDRFGHITQKSDPGRELERWLIEAGAGYLQQGELEVVRNDLQH